eukprot:365494-Chlamydomonas_euryale.AAC.7
MLPVGLRPVRARLPQPLANVPRREAFAPRAWAIYLAWRAAARDVQRREAQAQGGGGGADPNGPGLGLSQAPSIRASACDASREPRSLRAPRLSANAWGDGGRKASAAARREIAAIRGGPARTYENPSAQVPARLGASHCCSAPDAVAAGWAFRTWVERCGGGTPASLVCVCKRQLPGGLCRRLVSPAVSAWHGHPTSRAP